MNRAKYFVAVAVATLTLACSAISPELSREAGTLPDYDVLLGKPTEYIGETVVLGGYVLSVNNRKDSTQIVAIEAPLGTGQRPKSKDLSRGRLILDIEGFIDPEVYTKDRQITVGGRIMARVPDATFPHLRISVDELHLWPIPKPSPPPHYYDDHWCGYPWWPFYPWRHRGWCD